MFSSIDHGGRYAYGNQPRIAHWNLARLGETLLPLFARHAGAGRRGGQRACSATFAGRYEAHWLAGMRAKLGLDERERRRRRAGAPTSSTLLDGPAPST